MNTVITKIAIALALFIFGMASAQEWEVVTGLPQTEFTVVKSIDAQIYAAAQNKLYISQDGTNWQSETIHPIGITPNCITIFNNILYVGTLADGVYYRNLTAGSPWNHALMGLHISHFLVHDGLLHLCSQGSGIWRNVAGTWNNMTSNLPTYSYTVTKIISLNDTLYALAGANGTFYRFNIATNKWDEDYYFANTYLPGLIIDDAVIDNGAILAANGHRLIRTDDEAQSWNTDAVGTINGINRILHKGIENIYVLTLDPNTNFTNLQKRSNNAPAQSSWGNADELLSFYSYAIDEFQGKIYIASDLGVYVKSETSLGVGNPTRETFNITIYPSPSRDGNINMIGSSVIEEVTVYDLSGRPILSKTIDSLEGTINIPRQGIYLVRAISDGQAFVQKAIVQ